MAIDDGLTAQRYIGEVIYIHKALYEHEKDIRRRWRRKIAKNILREIDARAIGDESELTEARDLRHYYEERLKCKRQYRWTFATVLKTLKGSPAVIGNTTVSHIKVLKDYLGLDVGDPKYYEVDEGRYIALKKAFQHFGISSQFLTEYHINWMEKQRTPTSYEAMSNGY